MLTPESRLRDFPTLQQKTYLNTAAEGIPPQAVPAALKRYAEDKQLGMDGREPHFAQWNRAKELVAALFGLEAEEVSICSCASEAFNLAAGALRLCEGDEIVINDLDFPAGATPWLQASCPATVRVWRARDWALQVDDLIPLLNPRTRLVTTSLVSFFNGYMLPLAEVVATVRKHSPALFALDVTQALGRKPLDLTDVDLIVSSTHKWILSTHGGGLVGVPKRNAETWTTAAGGWFNLQDAFGPERFERAVSQVGAASFTVGMPNFPAVYATVAALEYLDTIGVEAIDAHAQPLVDACLEGLQSLPVEVITPHTQPLAGILAFRHPDAERIHQSLLEENVHVMSHAGRIRIALHGYNNREDVEQLLRALRRALG